MTLLIGIFYCLNYTLLLLHLITRHLSLSSIIFSISTLIIGLFYCLDCTLLSLHLVITNLAIDFIITMQLTYVLGNHHGLYKYNKCSVYSSIIIFVWLKCSTTNIMRSKRVGDCFLVYSSLISTVCLKCIFPTYFIKLP